MMQTDDNPARNIIKRLGGPNQVAALLSVHKTRAYEWNRHGQIPAPQMAALLSYCEKKGIRIAAKDALAAVVKREGAA